mgnify:CR=1 FL=1
MPLQVPASAEIVVEGWIDPDPATWEEEGPFADYPGYLGGKPSPKPVVEVSCITHRNDPIMRGALEGGHTKNLFLKDKKSNYFLLTAEEDSDVNLKTLHKLLGASGRFSFGKAEMMQDLLGVTPGAVTALGVINDREGRLTFAIDQRLLRHEKINCHPLTNEATTTLLCDDLLSFARACGHDPMIVDLASDV